MKFEVPLISVDVMPNWVSDGSVGREPVDAVAYVAIFGEHVGAINVHPQSSEDEIKTFLLESIMSGPLAAAAKEFGPNDRS